MTRPFIFDTVLELDWPALNAFIQDPVPRVYVLLGLAHSKYDTIRNLPFSVYALTQHQSPFLSTPLRLCYRT